jgi:hypothetical protein
MLWCGSISLSTLSSSLHSLSLSRSLTAAVAFHQLSRAAVAVAVDVMFADCESALAELFTKTWSVSLSLTPSPSLSFSSLIVLCDRLEKILIGNVVATLRSYFGDLKFAMGQFLFTKLVSDSLDYLLSIYLEALLSKTNFKLSAVAISHFEADIKYDLNGERFFLSVSLC